MYDLKNKIVLVTGASSGIGQATAVAFAKQWSKVIIHYNQNEDWAQKTQEDISKL